MRPMCISVPKYFEQHVIDTGKVQMGNMNIVTMNAAVHSAD